MLTVHPSIMLGSYLWDEERLPRDEFDIRLKPLREAIASRGWAGAIVYGDARTHEGLAFFTNFIPRMRWAMALFPAKGEPRLLISMSSRDMPAMRTMTMIPDPKSGWEWRWFDEWRDTLPAAGGTIGTIGFDDITPLLLGNIEKSFGDRFTLADADDILATARATHRPREIAVIREAAGIARAASTAFRAAWEKGDDVETAALKAETVARQMAVQDVRTLVSRDGGGTLQPYRASFGDRPKSLLGYVAVKYLGYWADSYVNVGAPQAVHGRALEALDALLSATAAGNSFDRIAAAAAEQLGSGAHPALSGGFGGRIGLSLREGETIRRGAPASVAPGTAYSLHAGAVDPQGGGSIVSALVVAKRKGGVELLLHSDKD